MKTKKTICHSAADRRLWCIITTYCTISCLVTPTVPELFTLPFKVLNRFFSSFQFGHDILFLLLFFTHFGGGFQLIFTSDKIESLTFSRCSSLQFLLDRLGLFSLSVSLSLLLHFLLLHSLSSLFAVPAH